MSVLSGQTDDRSQGRSELDPSRQQQLNAWAGIDEFLIARYLSGSCTAEEVACVEQGMARSQQVRDCISIARDASEKIKAIPPAEKRPSVAVTAMEKLSPERQQSVLRRLKRELKMVDPPIIVPITIGPIRPPLTGGRVPTPLVACMPASVVTVAKKSSRFRPFRDGCIDFFREFSIATAVAVLLVGAATWHWERDLWQNNTAMKDGPKSDPARPTGDYGSDDTLLPKIGDDSEPREVAYTVARPKALLDPTALRGWAFSDHQLTVMRPVYEDSSREERITGELVGQPGKTATILRAVPQKTVRWVSETLTRREVFRQDTTFDRFDAQLDSPPLSAVKELVGLLDDNDAICRSAAMTALRYQEPSVVLRALVEAGASERASFFKRTGQLLVIIDDADLTLSSLAYPASVALNSENSSTRWAGLYVLIRLFQSHAIALDVPSHGTPRITIPEPSPQLPSVAQLDVESGTGLIRRLIELRSDKELLIRKTSLYLLGEIGPSAYDAVESLVQTFVESKDPVEKRWAAFALAQIGIPSERALPSLIKALDGQDDVVPPAAAFAIGHIIETVPDHESTQALIKKHAIAATVIPVMQRWQESASPGRKQWAEYVLHVLSEVPNNSSDPSPFVPDSKRSEKLPSKNTKEQTVQPRQKLKPISRPGVIPIPENSKSQ